MILSDIKKEARENLDGKLGNAALLTFIYLGIVMCIEIVYFLFSWIPLIHFVVYLGVNLVLFTIQFGLILTYIDLKNGNNIEYVDYFKNGFGNFKKIWCIFGNIFKKIWVYILIIFVLQIALIFCGTSISAFSSLYSHNNSALLFMSSIFSMLILAIIIISYIATYILFIIKSFYYVLVPYILWDNPDMSAKEIVEKSQELMKGYRGKFFLLNLSFIGWELLSIFTFGIGFIWLIPYITFSQIAFYEKRLEELNNNSNIEIETKTDTDSNVETISDENDKNSEISNDTEAIKIDDSNVDILDENNNEN